MYERIIMLLTSFIAAMIVMIIHEVPKSISYILHNPKKIKNLKYVLKFYLYLDPIGVILFVICQAGFSKPYMYGIRDRKNNIRLGVIGFLSTLLLAVLASGIFAYCFPDDIVFDKTDVTTYLLYSLIYYIVLFSITMMFVNLFPVSTFDFPLIIAGIYPNRYFTIIKADIFSKLLLLLFIIIGVVSFVGQALSNVFIDMFRSVL